MHGVVLKNQLYHFLLIQSLRAHTKSHADFCLPRKKKKKKPDRSSLLSDCCYNGRLSLTEQLIRNVIHSHL